MVRGGGVWCGQGSRGMVWSGEEGVVRSGEEGYGMVKGGGCSFRGGGEMGFILTLVSWEIAGQVRLHYLLFKDVLLVQK